MVNPNLARNVAILCIVMMPLGQMGIDIYTPSMPSMVQVFSTTASAIQLTVTLFTFGLSVALLLTGPVIDRFGRYPFLLLGMSLYLVTALLSGLTQELSILYIARIMQGIGAGITITTARACISDCFEGEELARVISNMAIVWSMTPILAPYLGGYIQDYIGWYGNFLFMGFYCGIILFIAAFSLNETISSKNKHAICVQVILLNYKRILSSKELIGYVVPMCFVYGYIIFFVVVAPFILQNKFGLSPVQFGKIILFVSATQMLGNIINKKLLSHVQRKTIIFFALAFSNLVNVVQLLFTISGYFNLYVFLIPATLNLGAIGFIYANSVGNAMALFRDVAGSTSSLLGFLPMITCALATIAATHLPTDSLMGFSVLVVLCYAIAIIVYFRYVYSVESPR